MFSTALLALAAAASGQPATAPDPTVQPLKEIFQGPMPATNTYLLPGHKGSDDRMFPDIAIGGLRIDGDTLYVRVLNKGRSPTPGPVLVAARADENGSKTGVVEQRTARLLPGEGRWVPLRGFSIKTAAASPTVFALESASTVAAVARMVPVSTDVLDRSGQARGAGRADADESNNSLSLAGSAIPRGRPQ